MACRDSNDGRCDRGRLSQRCEPLLESRFVRGFVAGLLAAVPSVLAGYFGRYVLHLSHNLFRNFISMLVYGRVATSTIERVFTQGIQFGFMGAIGIIIAFIVYWTGEDGVYIKSMTITAAVWFVVYVFGSAFRIPLMYHADVGTAFTHFFDALIFGAVWPLAMRWLEPASVR